MTVSETSPGPVARSFAEHIRNFHASLPADEQKLLEKVFALAEQATSQGAEVQGFVYTPDERGEHPWITAELEEVLGNPIFH